MVGWGTSPNRDVAVIWDQTNGLRHLEDVLRVEYKTAISDWKLLRATGISDDGHTIVGFGTNSTGQIEGWVVKLQ